MSEAQGEIIAADSGTRGQQNASSDPYGHRLAQWERRAEWPLVIAACAFLGAYATQILARPGGVLEAAAEATLWVTWAMFLGDYVVRLAIARRRGRWFVRHLLDLAIVVLPMLRPLRLMRFFTVLAIIQRNTGTMLRGKVAIYTVGATVLTVIVAGLAVFDAERGSGGSIRSFGDAVWWAFVSIMTVGYGDYVPVTVTGRIVAVGLMIGGIALIGVVTATLASWIVERVSVRADAAAVATESQVEALRTEVAELKEMIRALGARPAR
ncbi:potassium channel family protein [Microbacterium sp. 10M-3C3]|uniref:potassium channel family protein n=1 Tax=Microbacterium sp. 10M-3C3 TaxID=2483401 RepID=UPI001F0C2AE4|nr:potassium channel family protein [Microbacterium sp. 10M-3C3]